MSENTHSARVILAKIESVAQELTQNVSFEKRKELNQKLEELTERLREINEQNRK